MTIFIFSLFLNQKNIEDNLNNKKLIEFITDDMRSIQVINLYNLCFIKKKENLVFNKKSSIIIIKLFSQELNLKVNKKLSKKSKKTLLI